MTKRRKNRAHIHRQLGYDIWSGQNILGSAKQKLEAINNEGSYPGRSLENKKFRFRTPGEQGVSFPDLPRKEQKYQDVDYKAQLVEKRKLKAYYANLSLNQLTQVFKDARTVNDAIRKLECRLDQVILRLRFVKTIFEARQFLNHGNILVNGNLANKPSYQVKLGDVIQIRHQRAYSRVLGNMVKVVNVGDKTFRYIPSPSPILEFNLKTMTAMFIIMPRLGQSFVTETRFTTMKESISNRKL